MIFFCLFINGVLLYNSEITTTNVQMDLFNINVLKFNDRNDVQESEVCETFD